MRIVNYTLLAFCSMAAACGKSDKVAGSGSGSGESKTLHLTPIANLNQETPLVNSHADVTGRSSLMMNYRSYVEIGAGETKVDAPVYPRVRKMANGNYILFYQNNQVGADSYYMISSDLRNWNGGDRLFARHAITDQNGAANERRFSTCNGLVLANGDIIAVASYRANRDYRNLPLDNGLIMRRSTDNGATWSAPMEIYRGTNWEPHLMQLPSGDIHCYFTDSRTHIDEHNTGTGLIVSNDNGATWNPSFGSAPYRVIRKKYGQQGGVSFFTDQMPGVIKLNNSNQLVAALESYNNTSNYYLSLAYTGNDGQWSHLLETEEGPTDRNNYVFPGAGPSLAQFPSGETVLSYNTASLFNLRMGDATARSFGEPYLPFSKKGFWGTIEKIDAHQLIGSMHTAGSLMLATFVLNHRITASSRTVQVDADNSEWTNADNALFVGQKSQAQATLRCASDEKNVYFLVEVQDEQISKDDYVIIYLSPSGGTGQLNADSRRIRVSHSGLKSADIYGGGWRETDLGVTVSNAYDGSISNNTDTDNGYLVEIAIPKSKLNLSGDLLLNFSLFDVQGGEDAIAASTSKSTANWVPVRF